MAGGKTLTVYLAADLSKFNNGIDKAKGGLSGFEKGLIAAGAAVGAFALDMAIDGVKAAMEEEAALAKLNTTLGNLGFAGASAQVNTFIDDLQFASGVADDELRPAFDRLVRSTKDVDEAQRVLKIAMDAAAGTGKSLQTVADALGKAYDGNTTALGRLGLGIDKATLQSSSLQEITDRLSRTFSGQADKAANTYEGQIKRLSIGFDELKESFGQGFLQALGKTNGQTEDLIGLMRDLQPLISDIGSKFGQTAQSISYLLLKGQGLITWLDDLSGSLKIASGAMDFFMEFFNFGPTMINKTAGYIRQLTGDIEASGVAAFNTGGHLRLYAQSLGGVSDAQRSQAEHAFRATETNNSFAGSLAAAEAAQTSYGGSVEKTNPKIEAQTTLIGSLITRLGEEKTALDNAVTARNAYSASLAQDITQGTQLKDFFDPKDVEGSIAKYADALGNDAQFSDALAKLGSTLPNTPGAQAFIDNIVGLGTVSGQAFLDGLTPKVAEDLVKQLDDSISTINGNTFLLANKFYGEGIEAATQLIDGTVVQIAKEEKRLRKIGQNIGKPIGANIKAEIAQAVADAVAAAEAAKTAAAAERAAKAAATNVTVTEQQVAKALQSLIVNADKRSTGQVGVLQ